MAKLRPGTAAVLLVLGLAACTGESSQGSWVDAARVEAGADEGAVDDVAGGGALPSTVACEPLGVDDPLRSEAPTASPAGVEVHRGNDNDPHTATGARQPAGPDMVRTAPPSSPVSVVVARPVDPDEHVAARQADGQDTGPVPPPRYVPGAGSPASMGDASTAATTSTTEPDDTSGEGGSASPSPGPCIPVLGP